MDLGSAPLSVYQDIPDISRAWATGNLRLTAGDWEVSRAILPDEIGRRWLDENTHRVLPRDAEVVFPFFIFGCDSRDER
jgi:hypothetical protein